MITVAIYIKDVDTLDYNRIDLFDDEKISVVSSIQNINDLSKTYTDFSQTFVVPASKQNNKIFRHWYDNSNDAPFSTLVKSDAYIEIDTITFRKGKIQLESANVVDGQAQDYSITFIGILGNLKDKFGGLYLTDLNKNTDYDFVYNGATVKNRVEGFAPDDVMFPLISSKRNWNYGKGGADDISVSANGIKYNELFPALTLRAVFNMIETQFDITLTGFIDGINDRFYNAFLYLKNSDEFIFTPTPIQIIWTQGSSITVPTYVARQNYKTIAITYLGTPMEVTILIYRNGVQYTSLTKQVGSTIETFNFGALPNNGSTYTFYIIAGATTTYTSTAIIETRTYSGSLLSTDTWTFASPKTITVAKLSVKSYFPEITIIDFFTGVLKMFNLTCYSNDGVNYILDTIDDYYLAGSDIDITKYVISDKKNLNRVKTYKKIGFDYEVSESVINVGFKGNSGFEYGSLNYNTNSDGEDYAVKLPFENLNFQNLSGQFQVGYTLKPDLTRYIPKPIILYAYTLGSAISTPPFYFFTTLTGTVFQLDTYTAFGQETFADGDFYSLNFNEQQSTLNNQLIQKGLYDTYYVNYFNNIFNLKARLIKVSAILPTSILTTLKLNDNVIIRDTKYLINTFTTDLTTGEVQFELLTDQRL